MFFHETLQKNGRDVFTVGELTPITFVDTNSGILLENGGMAYCCVFGGLEGLFRKDQEKPFKYGRHLCDLVKDTFECEGFFTSDELPRYGITRKERRELLAAMGVEAGQGDLVAIFAYDETFSHRIRAFLVDYFTQELYGTAQQPQMSYLDFQQVVLKW